MAEGHTRARRASPLGGPGQAPLKNFELFNAVLVITFRAVFREVTWLSTFKTPALSHEVSV